MAKPAAITAKSLSKPLFETSGSKLHLRIVEAAQKTKLSAKPVTANSAKLEHADDLDDMWDNVPV